MLDRTAIADAVKQQMDVQGYSAPSLGVAAGVSEKTVRRILAGETVYDRNLIALAKVLYGDDRRDALHRIGRGQAQDPEPEGLAEQIGHLETRVDRLTDLVQEFLRHTSR